MPAYVHAHLDFLLLAMIGQEPRDAHSMRHELRERFGARSTLPAADLLDVALPPAQQAHSAAPGRSPPLSAHHVGAPLAGNENPRLGVFREGNRGPSSTTRSWRTAGGHCRPGGSGARTETVSEADLADDVPTGVPLSLSDATRQYATSSTTGPNR
jgi:hypothetical protein